jgi:3-hydroxyisobutyrate dehydrogenase-like beta-hydroxyacid dehydrogenase
LSIGPSAKDVRRKAQPRPEGCSAWPRTAGIYRLARVRIEPLATSSISSAIVACVIAAYARECRRLGDAGAGQTTKMVNQICIAGLLQGLAEGVAFAQRAGLDVDEVVDTISKGAAGSWQMENRARTMAAGDFDFGFAVEWMRKDLAIALAEADRLGARMPVAALVDQFYKQVMERGGSRWDTSSLVQLLQQP